MRGFILICLSAVAIAAPQGYNYNPTSAGYGAVGLASPGQTTSQLSVFGQSSSAGGAFLQGANAGYAAAAPKQPALISKRFFIHTAPEDNEDSNIEKHITVGVPRKNYNVVFIKSSKGSQRKATIKITPATNEEKTVIYVLNKKSGNTEIDTQVLEQPSVITKPEVYFIKYKTAEEAHHAQKKIQAQYDALGGNTQINDEGVGQVSSVIGALGGGVGGAVGGGVSGAIGGGAVNGGYLPPQNFH